MPPKGIVRSLLVRLAQENAEATISTNLLCVPGSHRLIGIYQPDEPKGQEGKLLHAVFVSAEVLLDEE